MRLEYKNVTELAVFPKSSNEKPFIKAECVKTYYCVLELKTSYYSKEERHWYDKGYYVIPVYLSAHRWMCGNKIVLYAREFCYMFGQIRENEPQDVPREKWYIARDFKKYYGLTLTTLGYIAYLENVELYDNVYEAINRAKELDKRLKIYTAIEEKTKTLENETKLKTKLEKTLAGLKGKSTKTSQLKYELGLITRINRENRIKKLKEDIKTLNSELQTIEQFRGVKKGEIQYE